MRTTKIQTMPDNSKSEDFVGLLYKVMGDKCQTGTHPGVSALSESIKRTDAYLKAQEKINDLCLPYVEHPIDCLTNTLKEAV